CLLVWTSARSATHHDGADFPASALLREVRGALVLTIEVYARFATSALAGGTAFLAVILSGRLLSACTSACTCRSCCRISGYRFVRYRCTRALARSRLR